MQCRRSLERVYDLFIVPERQHTATTQAPPELKSFTLTFAGVGPAETMTVAGGPWGAPVALVRCPP